MTDIKFERIERACDHNEKCRREHRGTGPVRGLIYDFKVLIDSEHRAEMHRDYSGKSYHVQDANGDPIDPLVRHYRIGRKVDSQNRFQYHITDLLDHQQIPTLEELAENRAKRAAKIEKRKAEQADSYRIYAIRGAGMYLYAALQLARAEIHNPGAARASGIDILDVIEQAFAQAEWKEHRDPELIEYEAKHC